MEIIETEQNSVEDAARWAVELGLQRGAADWTLRARPVIRA